MHKNAIPLSVSINGSTGTNQVAVAVGIVHTVHHRPEFVMFRPFQRKCSLDTAVGVRPVFCRYIQLGMRGIFQQIIRLVS